jgi:hypothetical protein
MDDIDNQEVQEIVELQNRIGQRLEELRYKDDDSAGNIIHHLAEVAVMGKNLAQRSLPTFLALPMDEQEKLADLIVRLQYDLTEPNEAIADMESDLNRPVNFLNL